MQDTTHPLPVYIKLVNLSMSCLSLKAGKENLLECVSNSQENQAAKSLFLEIFHLNCQSGSSAVKQLPLSLSLTNHIFKTRLCTCLNTSFEDIKALGFWDSLYVFAGKPFIDFMRSPCLTAWSVQRRRSLTGEHFFFPGKGKLEC